MLSLNDLTSIPLETLTRIAGCLHDLMFPADNQPPIITGYNFYNQLAKDDRVVTCSHIHSTDLYREAMISDLTKIGYSPDYLGNHIRIKGARYIWNPRYIIRDKKGKIFPNLRIQERKMASYLDLILEGERLIDNPIHMASNPSFIAEDNGWQLDLPFRNISELERLCDLILTKSALYLVNPDGVKTYEAEEEFKKRSPWPDAYVLPVVILGEKALLYPSLLSDFAPATRIVLADYGHEISLVLNRNLDRLHHSGQYDLLIRMGFCEEPCLVNRPFLQELDKQRVWDSES